MNRRLFRFLAVASGGYAWRSLKNCVKFLIGRQTYFSVHDFFLRQYIAHLTGLRPIRITCSGLSGEGAGSQALMIMHAINFARSSGLTYVHTPFTLICHAERPMQEWVTAWENLFNLGAGEAACDSKGRGVIDFCYNWFDLELCFGWRDRGADLARRFKAMIPECRRKYYLGASPRVTDQVTVAVHIRRGDVSSDNTDRFTSAEVILRTIAAVISILDTHTIRRRIRVYSQGKIADFAEFSLPGVELFLDADAIWTMQELIEADILIMAKGCFSYYAALISDGIKVFEPVTLSGNSLPGWEWAWWYLSPMDDWLPCLADGSFDGAAFERQLFLLMQAKL